MPGDPSPIVADSPAGLWIHGDARTALEPAPDEAACPRRARSGPANGLCQAPGRPADPQLRGQDLGFDDASPPVLPRSH